MGAMETMMINAGLVQIGKHLGLPTHAYQGLSDAKIVDGQAGLEVVQVMAAIDRSLEFKGIPVSVQDGKLVGALAAFSPNGTHEAVSSGVPDVELAQVR